MTFFRDINENNGLKLQLFYKQLSRLNHLAVIVIIKYLAIKSILLMISKYNNGTFSSSPHICVKPRITLKRVAKGFFGISLDFTDFQNSKNIFQGLTPKYQKNPFSIFCT